MNTKLEIVNVRLKPEPFYKQEVFVKTSSQVADLFRNEMCDYPENTFCLLCIGTKGRVLNQQLMSREDFRLKERQLLSLAVVSNAATLILLSNSKYDEHLQELTDSFFYDCKKTGISLMDHIFEIGADSQRTMQGESLIDTDRKTGFFNEAYAPDFNSETFHKDAEVTLKTSHFMEFDEELTKETAAFVIAEDIKLYDREIMVVMNLDDEDHVLNAHYVSIGDLNSSYAHPREVFKSSLLSGASSIEIFHNHPSGDNEPSIVDIDMIGRIIECGNIFGIDVRESYVVAGRTGGIKKMINNDEEVLIGSGGQVLMNTANEPTDNMKPSTTKKKAKCR